MKKMVAKLQQKMGKAYLPVLFIVFSLATFFIVQGSVLPKPLDIKLYQVADRTIRANAIVEDTAKTKEMQKAAASNVESVYTFSTDAAANQVNHVDSAFALIEKEETIWDKENKKKKRDISEADIAKEKLSLLKSAYTSDSSEHASFLQNIPDWLYLQLFDWNQMQRDDVKNLIEKMLTSKMHKRIRETQLSDIQKAAIDEINSSRLDSDVKKVAVYFAENTIIPNEVYNKKATDVQKAEAVKSVKPAMILQGQVVVQEGHIVDKNSMHQLEVLGLVNQKFSIIPMISLIVLILVEVLALLYLQRQDMDRKSTYKMDLTFYVVTMLLSIGLMKMLDLLKTANLPYVALLFPAAFVPLILVLFVSRRMAMLSTIFQAAFSIFIFYTSTGNGLTALVTLFYTFSGIMAMMMKRKRIANQLRNAIFWLILMNVLFLFVLIDFQGVSFATKSAWEMLVYGFIGSLIAYILSIGLYPYIELIMSDDSLIVLNELSNPSQPLMKRILEEAPGTYHHSLMVANLSANAVEEIGGRSFLTRVACYYHDVGKLINPHFFVENLPQGGKNPHDYLAPEESKEIIISHVTEGVKMLEAENMPQMVIDICAQHHGTTLVKYFYIKAKEKDSDIKKVDFCYPGPKPQTKEAAVVNIADSCEAAVRAMPEPTNEKIKKFVNELIQSRIEEGQFSECDISLKELKIVEKSICDGLCSTFHSRIQYPKMPHDDQTKEGETV